MSRQSKSYPVYTVSRELPAWVQRGHTQFHNQHAGPAEVAKDILLQSSTVGYSFDDLMKANQLFYGRLTPDVIWNWTTRYCDEFLDEMEELGKDLIQVNWSCGFSTPSEAIQRRIVTEFTQKAHKRGIRICAYLSLTNIYWKDAFEHEPQLKDLTARYSNGQARFYGYSQARYLACINNPAWLEYLKNKIRMAIEDADVDAIYFDNLSGACACNICKSLFADFTERLVDKRYDVPLLEKIYPPSVKRDKDDEILISESTQQQVLDEDEGITRQYLFNKFTAHCLAESLKQLRDYAFSLKFPLAFSANNHLDPFVNDVCNVLYSQDTSPPGPDWSNIPYLRYLAAESEGWKPVVTNHRLDDDADPRLSMAEAMAFQSYPYQITHKAYNLFYREHPELFTDVQPMAKIGVVLEWPRRKPYYLQPLGMNNLLYEVVLPDKWTSEQLARYTVIFLPDLQGVSDALCEALKDFEAKGGVVVTSGASMVYDGFARKRKDSTQKPHEKLDVNARLSPEIIDRIRRASDPQYVKIDAPRTVVANLVRKTDDSAYILHLINYDQTECGPVQVNVDIPRRTLTQATLLSPDASATPTNVSLSQGTSVLLDRFDVYSIIKLVVSRNFRTFFVDIL